MVMRVVGLRNGLWPILYHYPPPTVYGTKLRLSPREVGRHDVPAFLGGLPSQSMSLVAVRGVDKQCLLDLCIRCCDGAQAAS